MNPVFAVGGNMDMASYLFRTFAAAGIVVAAVEHTDGTASYTTKEDESPQPFAPLLMPRKEQLKHRAEELLAAAEQLAEPGAGSLLAGLSLGDTFFGGHSFGGPAALLAASLAAQRGLTVKGLLLHDPALGMGADVWAIRRGPRGTPTLSYVSDEYDRYGVRCGDATLHTVGGFHGNFVDAPLWAPNWVMAPLSFIIPASGPCDEVEMHATLAKSARHFFTAVSEGRDVTAATQEILEGAAIEKPGTGRRPLLEMAGTSADAR